MSEATPSPTTPSDRPVAFRVLGPVEAVVDTIPLALGGRRQRALLAVLLTTPGRVVSADRLIDELWAGEPPDGSDITLRTYVSRLRATRLPVLVLGSAPAGPDLTTEILASPSREPPRPSAPGSTTVAG